MPAIDYMELLREEKRKQREKKKKSKPSSSSPSTEEEEKISTTAPTITTTSSTVKNGEDVDDVQQNCESKTTTSSTAAINSTGIIIPKWSYPLKELEFSSPSKFSRSKNGEGGERDNGLLLLKVLCENPKRISYCSPQSLFVDTTKTKTNIIQQQKRLTEWLNKIPSSHTGFNCWKTMKYGKRRVAMFGEEEDSLMKLLPQPLQQIADQLVTQGIFSLNQPPNHVLLNEYQPSQGILAHTDGPLYSSKTATLSLNSDVILIFTKRLTSNEIGLQNQNQNNNIINKKKSDTTIITDDDEGTTTTTVSSTNNSSTDNSNKNQQQEQPNNNRTPDDRRPTTTDPHPLSSNDKNNTNNDYMEVLLEAGSLIVFEDDAYINYCHEIKMDVMEEVTTTACLNAPPGIIINRQQRFSLTFRHKPPPP